jgi:hypothetical protein
MLSFMVINEPKHVALCIIRYTYFRVYGVGLYRVFSQQMKYLKKTFLIGHLLCDRLDLRRGAYQGSKFVVALCNEHFRCKVCSTVRCTRCCIFRDEIRAMYVSWIQILDCNVLILWCDIYSRASVWVLFTNFSSAPSPFSPFFPHQHISHSNPWEGF